MPREIAPTTLQICVAACVAAVATFLGLELRAWPPHEDETLALYVGSSSVGDLFETVLGERGGAPLHFLLAWLVAHAGGGLTGLRLVSALFALASLPVIAALATRLAGRTAALAATAIAAASWVLLFHAVYGRMYSLFLFTSTLSYLALLRALDRERTRPVARWTVWVGAILACVATHPYGALVLASQGVYVVARGHVRDAFRAFAAVGVLGIPFWWTDLVLASRFDVGVGGGGSKLGAPVPVLRYLARVAGDFSSGYPLVLALVLALAGVGAWRLWHERRDAAVLAAAAFGVPVGAFLVARIGGSASPESRHLIFALPFFATLLAVGFLRVRPRAGLAAPLLAVGVLLVAQVAWARSKTPELFKGEPTARIAARDAAARWLAETGRADDVLLGYEPVYLGAWERNAGFSRTVLPRADAKLAAKVLREAPKPLGRGVWVIDAWEKNNAFRRLELPVKYPYPREQFEVRSFGPYLLIRTREPTRTAERYLELAANVQILGKYLWIGDADVNYETVRAAAKRLGIE